MNNLLNLAYCKLLIKNNRLVELYLRYFNLLGCHFLRCIDYIAESSSKCSLCFALQQHVIHRVKMEAVVCPETCAPAPMAIWGHGVK